MPDSVPETLTFAQVLRTLSDEEIRKPLWEWTPAEIPAVIHERRRRFGVDDEDGENPNG